MNNKTIFINILRKLKYSIGETNYAIFFTSVELVSLENNTLVFGVPAEMFKNTIEKEYKEELQTIAEEEANITEIKIVVTDQKNAVKFFSTEELSASSTTNTQNVNVSSQISASTQTPPVLKKSSVTMNLDPNFTFDNFVVGESNSFAHSVATVIAKNPGVAHNPCLIYGDVGLGKTHLLQAIGNDAKERFFGLKILCYSSERFLNDFLQAIQTNKSREFKHTIRSADILLLDDIQFFSGKPTLQEEFFHSYNTLLTYQKQMVLTSDRPLHQIRDLEDRLRSRFRSSMMVDLQSPSPELAMGILNNAIEKYYKIQVNAEILNIIVERLRYNIRDMLGILKRIEGYEAITKTKITSQMVRGWTIEYIPKKVSQRKNTSEKIISITAMFYNSTVTELKSNTRNRRIARIRHIASYLLRNLTSNSLTEIGKLFNISHVSVSNAVSQIEREIDGDPLFADEIEDLKMKIQERGE